MFRRFQKRKCFVSCCLGFLTRPLLFLILKLYISERMSRSVRVFSKLYVKVAIDRVHKFRCPKIIRWGVFSGNEVNTLCFLAICQILLKSFRRVHMLVEFVRNHFFFRFCNSFKFIGFFSAAFHRRPTNDFFRVATS